MNAKRGFTPLVLLIIVTIVAIGAGAYIYSKKSDTSKVETVSQTPATASSTVSNSESNKTTQVVKDKPQPTVAKGNTSVKVIKTVTVGCCEPDANSLYGKNFPMFKLSPLDKAPTEFTVQNTKVSFKAISAQGIDDENFIPYKKEVCTRDRSHCQYYKDWMVISVNGTNIEFGREEIKEITFDNGLKIYFSAIDIEGSSSNYLGSNVAFALVK